MKRIPEPELMEDPEQAAAYDRADFSEPHDRFVRLFGERFEEGSWNGPVLDLGCGTADITIRFAKAFAAVDIHGVDGAESMLNLARNAVAREGLDPRIRLQHCRLPNESLPRGYYGAVISNSLLHHLSDPMTLWSAVVQVAEAGAPVFVMDLLRPETPERAAELVNVYAGGESDLLRRDFRHSLFAAYRLDEVEQQLRQGGLSRLRLQEVGDRHWIAWGRV